MAESIADELMRQSPTARYELVGMAEQHRAAGQLTEAETCLRKAIELNASGEPDTAGLRDIYSALADLKLEQGQAAEAEALLRRALELADQGRSRPVVVAEIRSLMARSLRALARLDDAEQQEALVTYILERGVGRDPVDSAHSKPADSRRGPWNAALRRARRAGPLPFPTEQERKCLAAVYTLARDNPRRYVSEIDLVETVRQRWPETRQSEVGVAAQRACEHGLLRQKQTKQRSALATRHLGSPMAPPTFQPVAAPAVLLARVWHSFHVHESPLPNDVRASFEEFARQVLVGDALADFEVWLREQSTGTNS